MPPLRDFVGNFLTVPGGRAYLVQVPGSAQSELDDAELAAVLNWMLGEFGPLEATRGLVPFTADEVAGYRVDPLADVETVRAGLLREMQSP